MAIMFVIFRHEVRQKPPKERVAKSKHSKRSKSRHDPVELKQGSRRKHDGKERRSPSDQQERKSHPVPGKKHSLPQLQWNLNEVLRIGSVLERFGVEVQRRVSFG